MTLLPQFQRMPLLRKVMAGAGTRLGLVCAVQIGLLLFTLASWSSAMAQEKNDNTGTNPINFTYDARFYTETSWLTADNSSLITNSFELRMPLGKTMSNLTNQKLGIFNDLGSRHALRFKYRSKSLNLETEPGTNTNISGNGDMDVPLPVYPPCDEQVGHRLGSRGVCPHGQQRPSR